MMHDLAILELSPDKVRNFTFAQLEDLIQAVARGLVRLQLSNGSRVALLAENSATYLACFLGIRQAGLTAVPVNIKLPDSQIRFILQDSDSALIFCDQARRASCPAGIPVIEFDHNFDQFLGTAAAVPELPSRSVERAAMILYTSGSTGKPKGVVISEKSRTWLIRRLLLDPQLNEKSDSAKPLQMVATPFFHLNGLTGAEVCFASRSPVILMSRFDPIRYIRAIELYRVALLTAVPPMLAMILREPAVETADLSSVQTIRLGGAPVSEGLLKQIRNRFTCAKVSVHYGITEIGGSLFGRHPDGIPTPSMSVGFPRTRIDYRLVDGVLQIKSPSMLTSYHKNSDLYEGSVTSDGYFDTKDVFRVDENGFFYFVGRKDDMFISGGENIYPREIEQVLEKHPGVISASVLGLPDPVKGTKPFAFVVRSEGVEISESELKDFVAANSPAYHIPKIVWFVAELPLTPSNKVDKVELRARALELLTDARVMEEMDS